MKNKKLSHNGLQGSVTSVMAALLCILIGLFVGFLVLPSIRPTHGQTALSASSRAASMMPPMVSARSWPTPRP